MKLIILNRTPAAAEGWIHIVPRGELPNREAGLVQVLDDEAFDSMLANIEADKARLGANWPGLYAGKEHFIYNDEQDSAAFAWFKNFEKRADGLWAKADGLTDLGREAVSNGRYKFTSFVADRRDTQKLDGNRVRILKLDTIGFTNQANGKELLTPITNRQTTFAGNPPADNQTKNQKDSMKSIATKLGLSAEASEDAVLAEVTKLQNRVAELTPHADENTALKNRLLALDGEQVDTILDLHQVKEAKLRNRLKPVLAGMADRAERVAALIDFGFKPAEAGKPAAAGRVLNRGESAAQLPQDGSTGATEQELAAKAEAEITVYRLVNRCSYGDARNAVRRTKPELFGINPTK